MTFSLTPTLVIKETDLTNNIIPNSLPIGAAIINGSWGEIDQVVSIASETDLVARFGKPNATNYEYFFQCASYLNYSRSIKVVRPAAGQLNASADEDGILVKNKDHYDLNYADGSAAAGEWIARYAGARGNSIKVSVCPANSTAYTGWAYKAQFYAAPNTSESLTSITGLTNHNDELHIVILDEDGLITGVKGTILEKYEGVSQCSGTRKADGTSNYYVDVINNSSSYIYWGAHASAFTNAGDTTEDVALGTTTAFATGTAALNYSLDGGADDFALSTGEIQSGLDFFANKDVAVNYLICPPLTDASATTIGNYVLNIAATRKDVVAFLSPPIELTAGVVDPQSDVQDYLDALTSTSYGVSDISAGYVYDKYNDTNRFIPMNGHNAGLRAETDRLVGEWFSHGGFTKGVVRNVIKLAWSPSDTITAQINRGAAMVAKPGRGIVVYSDQTLQSKFSAFSYLSIRNLFITLERQIGRAAEELFFEQNDAFTQARFKGLVEPFLRDVQGGRGISQFAVICDETNNPDATVSQGEFRADIYIVPVYPIYTITLNFVAVRGNVEFTTIVGNI